MCRRLGADNAHGLLYRQQGNRHVKRTNRTPISLLKGRATEKTPSNCLLAYSSAVNAVTKQSQLLLDGLGNPLSVRHVAVYSTGCTQLNNRIPLLGEGYIREENPEEIHKQVARRRRNDITIRGNMESDLVWVYT